MLSQRGDKSKGRLKEQAGEEQEQDGHGDVGTARSVSWRSDPEELSELLLLTLLTLLTLLPLVPLLQHSYSH